MTMMILERSAIISKFLRATGVSKVFMTLTFGTFNDQARYYHLSI